MISLAPHQALLFLYLLPYTLAVVSDSGSIIQNTVSSTDSRTVDQDIAPQVNIPNGMLIGITKDGVDSWNGVPFAQPPTGRNRLKPPQPLASSFGKFDASSRDIAVCPQFFATTGETSGPVHQFIGKFLNSPLVQSTFRESEDCLTINVQRPAGTKENAKLPVLVWFYGGAFVLGATVIPPIYDGTPIIKSSVKLGQPIMYVAINYRVAGFGFLPGKEVMNGNSNLGLRDQRFGLQWVQENIAKFGGDPSRVTIWGESAGAISVMDHLLINRGNNSYNGGKLFSAAIMNSGSVVPTGNVDTRKPQVVYDQVVSEAKCSEATDTLECLRGLSYDDVLNALNSVPAASGYRALDLPYLPRPDPSDDFFPVSPDTIADSTNFAKVPILMGNQEDEGSFFSILVTNISTSEDTLNYLKSYFPAADPALVERFADLYPDDPSAGSPYRTGNLYNYYPQAKRINAIFGDAIFIFPRRFVLSAISGQVPTYSYFADYDHAVPYVGTGHFTDVLEIFLGFPNKYPQDVIHNYYISFINSHDPNTLLNHTASPGTPGPTTRNLPEWPRWENEKRMALHFGVDHTDIVKDQFRMEAYNFVREKLRHFRI